MIFDTRKFSIQRINFNVIYLSIVFILQIYFFHIFARKAKEINESFFMRKQTKKKKSIEKTIATYKHAYN